MPKLSTASRNPISDLAYKIHDLLIQHGNEDEASCALRMAGDLCMFIPVRDCASESEDSSSCENRWLLFRVYNPHGFLMMAQRPYVGLLLLSLAMVCIYGCDTVDSSRSTSEQQKSKLADLKRQKDDVLYEMQLRQDEMDEMERSARRPGVVGVSKEWIQRHNNLREEIIRLRVKAHDLDLQIAELTSNQKVP